MEILDQTQLPDRVVNIQLVGIEDVFGAIRRLSVRGAPAIGIAAAYGLYLGMRDITIQTAVEFFQILDQKIDYLASARPTAVNLRWALQSIRQSLKKQHEVGVGTLKSQILQNAIALQEDDRRRCLDIARHGQSLIKSGSRILTICNTGALATGGIGTAFGAISYAHELKKEIEVFACETRPLLQGARLTMWELAQLNIPAKLVCDSAAASLMKQKLIDLVLVGADCVAADGGFANKIGTYGLAVLAKYHGLPFYVAAPLSTIDVKVLKHDTIPIEFRAEDEIRRVLGSLLITPPDAQCWNPAFDITSPELLSGIVTEKGIIYPPYRENILRLTKDADNWNGTVGAKSLK